MLLETDWGDTIGFGCSRGAAGPSAGAAQRTAIGAARQHTSRQTSAAAAPSSTRPAWPIPRRPAGTTPATRPRPSKPITVLIPLLYPKQQVTCQSIYLGRRYAP